MEWNGGILVEWWNSGMVEYGIVEWWNGGMELRTCTICQHCIIGASKHRA